MKKEYAFDGDIFESLEKLCAKYNYIKIVGYDKRCINGEYKDIIILENGEQLQEDDGIYRDKNGCECIFVSEVFCEGTFLVKHGKDIGVVKNKSVK